MKKIDLRKLVLSALMASFTCVATMIIQIPNGIGGYFNLGDCIVLLCGWLLGPFYGGLAAGIGSMLADFFSSYVIYAPATFIIKALMAIVAYFLLREGLAWTIISGVCAEILMILGYFIFEGALLYNFGTALAAMVTNSLQGIWGVVCAVLLKEFICRKKLWKF